MERNRPREVMVEKVVGDRAPDGMLGGEEVVVWWVKMELWLMWCKGRGGLGGGGVSHGWKWSEPGCYLPLTNPLPRFIQHDQRKYSIEGFPDGRVGEGEY